MRPLLDHALALGYLRQIDLHAGLFLQSLASPDGGELLLASVLASRAVGEGHICLPMSTVAGQRVFGAEFALTAPDLDLWREHLLSSGVVGRPGENTPLILDDADRLYLARYFTCERDIGADLQQRSSDMLAVDRQAAVVLLDRLFPEGVAVNWQKLAAALALLKQFVLISGGPGTGKTYTVARILALLQALADRPQRIALAAPTGKAAFRLHEAIVQAKESLDPELAAIVPEETMTIHRLLGVQQGSGTYRHNEENQLHLDLLVLDEASMIDVPLMAGIIKALPGKARLIMLGDRDQLTSVEAGSLFGDICTPDRAVWSPTLCRRLKELTGSDVTSSLSRKAFGDSIVVLQESYRFREKSWIGELALAVKYGKTERMTEVLSGEEHADLRHVQVDAGSFDSWLSREVFRGFHNCFSAATPREALAVFENFRVLCAVREGAAGVSGVNASAERIFRKKGMIQGGETWYRGRPVMIKVNHYGLQLFNGDTGIAWPDTDGRLWVWFLRQDGTIRKVAPSGLPDHETAYAITVHKSQGSEFAEVLLVLPQAESRVLNRELIYTGITRAREKLTVFGDMELLAAGVGRTIVRFSGLRDYLWEKAWNEGATV